MSKLKVGVIGAGHLGKIHARLLPEIEGIELVGIADPSPMVQRDLIEKTSVPVISDYKRLVDQVDAAIVATPTRSHFEIADYLLSRSVHVLLEKPMTDCPYQAKQLVELAELNDCVLSVGHVEQFNPAIRHALDVVGEPKFIQACRASGYTFRSTDIGVVHDLMIHDIDLINVAFAGSVSETRACGFAVFGDKEDIAQSRLTFSCGGVATLTASRCSFEAQRNMQVFGTDGFAAVDLANHKVRTVHYPAWMRNRQFDFAAATFEQQEFIKSNLFETVLPIDEVEPDRCNAILEEQREWINAIQNDTPLRNTGLNAAEAVRVADLVLRQISEHQWDGSNQGPVVDLATNSIGMLPAELRVDSDFAVRKAA